MITEAYVSFEVAKLLKEKGFDEICSLGYGNDGIIHPIPQIKNSELEHFLPKYSCPTQQMAMRWLREEKSTSIIIKFDVTERGYCPYVYQLDYDLDWVVKWRINMPMKYEEAVETVLKYCLENLI